MKRVLLARLSWALVVTMRRHTPPLSNFPWNPVAALYDCEFLSGGGLYRAIFSASTAVHAPPHAVSVRHSEGFRRYAVWLRLPARRWVCRAALPALMVVHAPPHAVSVRHSEGFGCYAVWLRLPERRWSCCAALPASMAVHMPPHAGWNILSLQLRHRRRSSRSRHFLLSFSILLVKPPVCV